MQNVKQEKERVKKKIWEALAGEHTSIALAAMESVSREIRLENGIRINNDVKKFKHKL
jgi:hypothetical protein